MVTRQEIWYATQRVAAGKYWSGGQRATRLRCSDKIWWALYRGTSPRQGITYPGSPDFQVFGLQVVRDKFMLPDVWQLTDEHATLLYDCRMRKR